MALPDTPDSINSLAAWINSDVRGKEIEVLSKEYLGGRDMLQDGPYLALSNEFITAAYLHCKTVFFSNLHDQDKASELMPLTGVMLLLDPDHITAINFRKRHIVSMENAPDSSELIQNEHLVVETLLTSRLRKHPKSSTLWAHRKWLLTRFTKVILRVDETERECWGLAVVEYALVEMEMITKASAHHPQNYHSWSYARWLYAFLARNCSPARCERLLEAMIDINLQFCMKYLHDTSAWTYLAYLTKQVLGTENITPATRALTRVVAAAIDLRLSQEPLWLYLREVGSANAKARLYIDPVCREIKPIRKA